ncbi:MAG: amidohydrolase family protein [Geopsychrobacter sp.]|nr:amidohydrolase family protein [Geopsychrobacter sp.]
MKKLALRLQNTTVKAKIIHDIKFGIPGWENMFHNAGWEKITISEIPSIENRDIEGQTVAEIALRRKRDPFELVLELIKQDGNNIKIISETMHEDNVAQFIKQPFAMIGSDSGFSQGKPHPRLYGAFPRVIRRFVRQLKALSMEEAIHTMSGMTARRLNLQDTGLIKKGFRADAVLFDPQTFSDTATYQDPCRFPEGLHSVIVNGAIVIEDSAHTGAATGILRRGLA